MNTGKQTELAPSWMKYKNHLGVGGKEAREFRRTDVLRVIKTLQMKFQTLRLIIA